MKRAAKLTAYYVSSTHWDREWYEPFQHFRHYLVQVMDQVMDTLARDPRYACFQTDGQAIILEDYLEIRPERAEQARQFAREGRLRLGPWHTLPDEFIVGPESLIRNLEEGIRVSREFGNVSRAGFICDLFGHVGQLPQIFAGFGIGSAFVFRGLNEDTHGGCFRWKSPDGSEVVAFQFGPREGYFDYGSYVRRAFQPLEPLSAEQAVQRLIEHAEVQRIRMGLDIVLLFDGGDHMTIEPRTPEWLAAASRAWRSAEFTLDRLREYYPPLKEREDELLADPAARPPLEVRHVGLDEFADALAARKARIPRVAEGELRDVGRLHWDGTWLIPGVAASRIRLKQANRAGEAALTLWAEPFGHLANGLAGAEYPHSYIRRAWRYLLENHAHDSICGCSPDQVHKDMEYRFDQARLISEKIIPAALRAIAERVEAPDLAGEQFTLTLFNPAQRDLDGPVDFELWFDEKTTSLFGEWFKYENKVGFRLYDAAGRELPYDYVSYAPQRRRWSRRWGRIPLGQECIVVTVTAPLKIPALGYTTIVCKPVAEATRHPTAKIVRGDRALENDRLRVDVLENGALRLLDKQSGQTYERLLVFEDRADIGDGWFHGAPVNDRILSSTASPAGVAVVADGGLRGTLCITNHLDVPECFEFDKKMRRSERTTSMRIETYLTLRAGADYVEFRTVIDNRVRDHRVRVLFETGAQADAYQCDSAFDVVERPIALPAENHRYKELAVETTPHATWTAVFDKQRGLAVVAPHQPEVAVRDAPERPLALTLFRGFRRTIFTDGEEGGQSLGRLEFVYRLVPLRGAPSPAHLAAHAQALAGGVRAWQVVQRDQLPAAQRTLPPTQGQLALSPGELVLTSFRRHPTKGYLELRLFNPTKRKIAETLTFASGLASAQQTDFEGKERAALQLVGGNRVKLVVEPKKIVTLALRPAKSAPSPTSAKPAKSASARSAKRRKR